jgi:hypothetical protein
MGILENFARIGHRSGLWAAVRQAAISRTNSSLLAAEESSVKFSFPSLGHVSWTWGVWVLHHQHLSSTAVDLIEEKANSKGAAVFVEELLVLENNLLLLLLLLL